MRPQKEINLRIGMNIKAAREEARYTQEELSELVGVTPNHLSAVERGVSGASLELIEKLCQLLCISTDQIFFGRPEKSGEEMSLFRKMEKLPQEQRRQLQMAFASILEVFEHRK